MKRDTFVHVVVFVLTIVCLVPAGAVETLESKPVDAFVFKNGYSLTAVEVELPTEPGVYRISHLPDSSLGAFWLTWPQGAELTNIKATVAETETDVDASSIVELLEANIGASVQVADDDAWYRGVIKAVPKRSQEPIVYPKDENVVPPPDPDERGSILILDDGEQTQVMSLRSIEKVRFLGAEAQMKLKRLSRENVVEFELSAPPSLAGRTMLVQYLAKGLSWSPSYVVDITDEDNAVISAKAVLVNDLIGLKDARAELVTGYPHLAFSDKSSHFSLKPLHQLIEELGRKTQERYFAGDEVMLKQAASYDAMGMGRAPSMPSQPVEGSAEEDLFFYPLDGVTLKKGERGYFPIFADEIPYEHIYTLALPEVIQPDVYIHQRGAQPTPDPVVWHTLKLENESSSPWTTAPAMTMKNGRILGQDVLKYTPRGATNDLKITQAVAVKAEHNEYEIERSNSQRFGSVNYVNVSVKGEVRVINYKDGPIELEIEKIVTGQVVDATGVSEVNKLVKGVQNINPQSQLIWKKTVEPGVDHALSLDYVYSIFVRM